MIGYIYYLNDIKVVMIWVLYCRIELVVLFVGDKISPGMNFPIYLLLGYLIHLRRGTFNLSYVQIWGNILKYFGYFKSLMGCKSILGSKEPTYPIVAVIITLFLGLSMSVH